ncbi:MULTISPECIES: cytochrome-c oxidase, cbb3-type subunit I [unclassified Caulobacter]|uniref:cytochrome-c oxidase, cbb3-type subunit I n=1 Tax=unclassified Caulobacter TaxID=2648921 RepID=UPI000D368E64|nr:MULTISPECIES: cytochrome-c oxidase, cbb3-type subunit I [unclassified Caulobacter]PTS87893.1 cytochrome-c oxidase, cbb3-type subunit I [Caulobacter sp. HMWF009]PTT06583.1 cytochrome-c oxidase, cbb3-type subunit I [Caulobacter sp. HMWF025]
MSAPPPSNDAAPPGAAVLLIISVVSAFLAIMGAGLTSDPIFRLQAETFALACVLAAFALNAGLSSGTLLHHPDRYSDGVIKAGVIATLFWAAAGLLVGVVIAAQLSWPRIFYFPELGFLNFGRLRPLHTSAVIFAFGGNALIATSFWVVQRTCKAKLAGGIAPWFVFWGYQLFIVLAATGYLMGATSGKEYSEPEWYTDLWLTIVWVAYLLVFLGTIWKRKEPHIYVANWFYLAMIVTIALLHLVNNAAVPVGLLNHKSYGVFSGVQDALVQWWYGHNAVGFFLTAGFLAMMYYFVPKRVERPVFSYRLSIVHFWALIFIYIWAGPHHLHYTALPQWAQTLGMTFSIMLWMPSWGGMINGLMTLSGAWDKLRTDPVVRMMVVSIAFYGMSTFEGPVMSIRAVNALSHYTDWTIGHVHSGALGWVGFISFGAIYCLVPWLWKKKAMYSNKLIEWHFWIATTGILLYIAAMWVSGIMEGLMWREYTPQGFLAYSFIETVSAKHIENIIRTVGGLMYLSGALIMIVNVWRTILMPSEAVSEQTPAPLATAIA